MNLKVVAIILSLSLLFFFGFQKISGYKNEYKNAEIEQLNILKYLPENNKLLFISNFDSSKIINNPQKDSNKKNQDDFLLIENSILDYLGIDLGNNKLEEIYNNELIISTSENNKKLKDDILIVFKIKPEKKLDDILNLSNEIDQGDNIIPIYRENKLNYLKYIYRTEDNYIITSSDKKLILNCINSSNDVKNKQFKYAKEISENFKNQKNILFTKIFEKSFFFNNDFFSKNNENTICTTFDFDDEYLILKSYLVNNNKNLDISSYKKITNKDTINDDNYQISIYSNLRNFIKYLQPLINDFQKSLLEEISHKVTQNILILNSSKDWIIAFEKNTEDQVDLSDVKKLKEFNKFSLKQNENNYSIYSKNILEEEEDLIKQFTYDDIYSVESEEFLIMSNNLINSSNLDLIKTKFFDLKRNIDTSDFIYTKVDIRDKSLNKIEYFSYFKDLDFLINKIFKIENAEFKEIIKESIPEKNPILYSETRLKIF